MTSVKALLGSPSPWAAICATVCTVPSILPPQESMMAAQSGKPAGSVLFSLEICLNTAFILCCSGWLHLAKIDCRSIRSYRVLQGSQALCQPSPYREEQGPCVSRRSTLELVAHPQG